MGLRLQTFPVLPAYPSAWSILTVALALDPGLLFVGCDDSRAVALDPGRGGALWAALGRRGAGVTVNLTANGGIQNVINNTGGATAPGIAVNTPRVTDHP